MAHKDDITKKPPTIEEEVNELRGTIHAVSMVSMLAFCQAYGDKDIVDAVNFLKKIVNTIKSSTPSKGAMKAKELQAMVRHLEIAINSMESSLSKFSK